MYKLIVSTLVAVLALSGTAYAQMQLMENPNKAIEKLLLLELVDEAGLDTYAMGEMLDGYKVYRDAMDELESRRDTLREEIQDAIAAGEAGYELTDKVRTLMGVDFEIFQTKQNAAQEAATVLDEVTSAKLYLVLSQMDKMTDEVCAAICGRGVEEEEAAPAPEKVILDALKVFSDEMMAGNYEKALSVFSDDFSHYEFGSKENFLGFLKDSEAMGDLDDLEVNIGDAKVEVDGDTAEISGVEITGSFGTADAELTLKNEGGEWKVVGMELYGV